MRNSVLVMLSNTPTWVYILFFFLLYRGIAAFKPRTLTIKKLVLLPVLFTALSLHMVFTAFEVDISLVMGWFLSILVGSTIGWLLVYRQIIAIDKKKWLLQLPGSAMTLVIILLVFASKYTIDFQLAVHPQLQYNSLFPMLASIVSGLCTGLFIGRLANYLYRYRVGPHTELDKSAA